MLFQVGAFERLSRDGPTLNCAGYDEQFSTLESGHGSALRLHVLVISHSHAIARQAGYINLLEDPELKVSSTSHQSLPLEHHSVDLYQKSTFAMKLAILTGELEIWIEGFYRLDGC